MRHGHELQDGDTHCKYRKVIWPCNANPGEHVGENVCKPARQTTVVAHGEPKITTEKEKKKNKEFVDTKIKIRQTETRIQERREREGGEEVPRETKN